MIRSSASCALEPARNAEAESVPRGPTAVKTSWSSFYYDADGVGGAAQVLFATVTAGTALTGADFLVVG